MRHKMAAKSVKFMVAFIKQKPVGKLKSIISVQNIRISLLADQQ